MPSFGLLAVIVLVVLAIGDLIAGVVNDAVNFINSAIGAKVSTRRVILIVASIGMIIGAVFSDGIIEVARKGVFEPAYFSATEAIMIFTAVAFADIILLDLYSTFGLPTSTTVSVIFELMGAAVILAFWKIGSFTEAWQVINSSSAIKILSGIILSVIVAFSVGLIIQFLSRLIFTFDYKKRLEKWGFLWCGAALSSLAFFIILKGGKHAKFMTPAIQDWVNIHTVDILLYGFIIFSILSFVLIRKRVNILKWIVLIGTGSLAMAFAGNDLANFIGVSVGGMHAFLGADLSGELSTPTWVLLLSGIVMSAALFRSKKAQTVTLTEINLASHEKHVMGCWKSNCVVEKLSRMVVFIFRIFLIPVPHKIKSQIATRWEGLIDLNEDKPAFDLVRASVNLMVAAALISLATSKQLPLSTTYVTFMVAMGTSLADGAWGKDCAPHRVAGVLAVIGSWFLTAILAFIMAGITVTVLFNLQITGLALLGAVVVLAVYKLYKLHERRTA